MLPNFIKIDRNIFPIGLGAMPLSIENKPSYQEAIDIIMHYLSLGGNFIDTANIYGTDSLDDNERLIAHALKKYGDANDIFICTKGGGTRPNKGWAFGAGSPAQLRVACTKSLTALNKDVIDLYYLHGPDPNVPFTESLGALHELKQEGKIRYIGIANVTLEQIKEALTITDIAAVQNRFNPFCKADFHNGVIEYCQLNNIIYVPYCPMGGWYDHANLAQDIAYRALTDKYSSSPYIINLSWILHKGEHLIPIPGVDRLYQVRENLKAINLKLDEQDIHYIESFEDRYKPCAN